MDPLQEHPNLFANGKFKIKIPSPNRETYNIEVFDAKHLIGEMPNKYTLIARSIEDMTDEEQIEAHEETYGWVNDYNKFVISNSFKARVYLLSIGVYPFDQTHFEDGTVLNVNEL